MKTIQSRINDLEGGSRPMSAMVDTLSVNLRDVAQIIELRLLGFALKEQSSMPVPRSATEGLRFEDVRARAAERQTLMERLQATDFDEREAVAAKAGYLLICPPRVATTPVA